MRLKRTQFISSLFHLLSPSSFLSCPLLSSLHLPSALILFPFLFNSSHPHSSSSSVLFCSYYLLYALLTPFLSSTLFPISKYPLSPLSLPIFFFLCSLSLLLRARSSDTPQVSMATVVTAAGCAVCKMRWRSYTKKINTQILINIQWSY